MFITKNRIVSKKKARKKSVYLKAWTNIVTTIAGIVYISSDQIQNR